MLNNRTPTKLVLLVMTACLAAQPGYAHPMGNFSVNHYTEIAFANGSIEIVYMIDMAEIPAYQEMQQGGIAAHEGGPSIPAYLERRGNSLRGNLLLEMDGRRLPLRTMSQQIIFPPGAGGLPTLKMAFVFQAQVPATGDLPPAVHLRYADLNFPGQAGWKEIVVKAPAGVLLVSSAPETDRSNRLSNYPTDLLNSPPQDLEASVTFSAGAWRASARGAAHMLRTQVESAKASHERPAARNNGKATATAIPEPPPLQENQQATPRNSFTQLIAERNLSVWFLLLAAAIAAGLGALHALEPGHGKTIVAAYLVGSRGTMRHALLLGLIVTAAHTAGVYLLGAITLYAQRYILPERIYPFLGVLSGILIAGMGCYLLLQRYLGAEFAHKHSYEVPSPGKTGSGELLVLGITGGIIPCPGALVVLLSAVSLHRTGLGLFLIVAFSVGLAAVLIGMGLAAVYAGRLLSRLWLEGPFIQRWLPMASATIITILGLGITVRALVAAGMVHVRL